MAWFKNLRIGRKLLLSNIILGILILMLALVSIQRLEVIESNVNDVGEILYAVDTLLQADRDLYQVLVAERSMIFSKPGSKEFNQLVADHDANLKQARQRVEKFMTYSHGEKIDELYAEYTEYRDQWELLTYKIKEQREGDTRAGRRTAIELSFGSAIDAFNKMRGQIDAMVEYTERFADKKNEETVLSVTSTQTTIVILLVISILIVGAIAVLFPRIIVKPIQQMTEKINELAGGEGDLTQKVQIFSRDEVGQMGMSVNAFIDSLGNLLGEIIKLGNFFSTQAEALNSSSERNHSLAESTTGETNMLATSITEMARSVQEVAQNASNAAAQAQSANHESEQGKVIVDSTKESIVSLSGDVLNSATAIEKLKDSATRIDAVVDVIRGIAEQTNLLALNAAIEAARAGEQGRGFAVVADEVRALASRTQTSTEEIQEMTSALKQSAEDAFDTMQQGKNSAERAVEQASKAWESLETINRAIQIMADMSTQIAAVAEQQSAVSSEISENANKLSMFSQESADISSDVKQSANTMASTASELSNHLARFKISG
ncbi:MAG: methyl-accepting chemotaxis protein [Pseudomonadales bacterium]|nr:methyl-accepting chemotaxis protein [Pseudomonadales bacterium]